MTDPPRKKSKHEVVSPMVMNFTPSGLTPINYERQYPPQTDLIFQSPVSPIPEDDFGEFVVTALESSTAFDQQFGTTYDNVLGTGTSSFEMPPPTLQDAPKSCLSSGGTNEQFSYIPEDDETKRPHAEVVEQMDTYQTPTTAATTATTATTATGSTYGHDFSAASDPSYASNAAFSMPPPPALMRQTSHKDFPFEDLGAKYTFQKYLGQGAYGKVIEAICNNTGARVAIKKIEKVFSNDTMAKRLLREIRILRELRKCPLVINVFDILPPSNPKTFDSLYIVFQYFEMDLHKLMASDQFLTTVQVKWIIWQMLVGLKYIHSCNIVHRDLKPANILVNVDCSLSICDFGLSRGLGNIKKQGHQRSLSSALLNPNSAFNQAVKSGITAPQTSRSLTHHVVTRWYRAPEVLMRTYYGTAIDLWAVGCIFGDLLQMQKENVRIQANRRPLFPGTLSTFSPDTTGEDPKQSTDQLGLIFNVIGTREIFSAEKNFQLPSGFEHRSGINYTAKFPGSTDDAIDLLRQFLRFDPNDRPTVDQALDHPYLTQVRNREFEVDHPEVDFEFEDDDLDTDTLRRLILREVELSRR